MAESRLREDYRFMLSSNWLKYIAFALIAAIACLFLASWQDSRRKERNAEIAVIEANYDAAPTSLSTALPDTGAALAPEREWTKVELKGSYRSADAVLARNRSLSGTPGFYVIVPFDLSDGTTVLVARGWVPVPNESGTASAAAAPQPAPGELTLTGWLRPTEDGSKDNNPDGIIRAIDATRVPGLDIGQTHSGAYVQLEAENPAGDPGLTPLPEPSLDPGSHLSYTMQWIAFGIMIIMAVFIAARRERIHREELAETAGNKASDYVVVDKELLAKGVKAAPTRYGANYRSVQKKHQPTHRAEQKEAQKTQRWKKRAERMISDAEYEDQQLDSQGL